MANNILEPFYLDLVQRETAHRKQLRQQQLEQEHQLTNNPPAESSKPEPEPQQDAPEAVAQDHENHPSAAPTEPRQRRREARSSPRTGEAAPRRHTKAPNGPNLNYHSSQCTICNHPEREDIDRAILHWHSPTAIAYEFDLPDRRIIYRHAQALGLFRLRAEQSRHALGFLIEQAQSIVPSADALIRAVRALSCIDDHGHWHEPRKEVVITHRYEEVSVPDNKDHSPDEPPRPPRTRRPRSRSSRPVTRQQTAGHRRENYSRPKRANWSTRLLSKFRRKSNATNKTPKIGRHT